MKDFFHGSRTGWGVGLLAVLTVQLLGCTSSWQAPMESRGGPASRGVVKTVRPSRRGTYYRVRKGDTLFSIAWRNDADFRSLARWNGIRAPYVIYPGQMIRLRPFQVARRAPPVVRERMPSSSAGVGRSPGTAGKRHERESKHRQHSTRDVRARQRLRSKLHAPAPKGIAGTGRLHWAWPTPGRVVAPWQAGDPLHKGIKIAGKAGQAVRAAESGKVVYSGSGLIGYGRLIIIKHNDNYLSAYGHNSKLLVSQGQLVTKGQKIAEMGKSNEGRALLHFEIRRDGKPVDPLVLLPRR